MEPKMKKCLKDCFNPAHCSYWSLDEEVFTNTAMYSPLLYVADDPNIWPLNP